MNPLGISTDTSNQTRIGLSGTSNASGDYAYLHISGRGGSCDDCWSTRVTLAGIFSFSVGTKREIIQNDTIINGVAIGITDGVDIDCA